MSNHCRRLVAVAMEQVKLVQLINCRLVRDGQILTEDDLYVRNGKIVDPEKVFFDEKGASHLRIDCKGALIAPGFIDLQINGKWLSRYRE